MNRLRLMLMTTIKGLFLQTHGTIQSSEPNLIRTRVLRKVPIKINEALEVAFFSAVKKGEPLHAS